MNVLDPLRPEMWLLAAVVLLWFVPTIMLKAHREPVLGFFFLNLFFGWMPPVWVALIVYATVAISHGWPVFRAPWATSRRRV